MLTARVSGSSVHEPPPADPGYEAGSALALQNALCWLSKAVAVWPTVTVTPGGTARKNLRVRPKAPPQPVKLLCRPAVVDERGLPWMARSVGPAPSQAVGDAVGLLVGARAAPH